MGDASTIDVGDEQTVSFAVVGGAAYSDGEPSLQGKTKKSGCLFIQMNETAGVRTLQRFGKGFYLIKHHAFHLPFFQIFHQRRNFLLSQGFLVSFGK